MIFGCDVFHRFTLRVLVVSYFKFFSQSLIFIVRAAALFSSRLRNLQTIVSLCEWEDLSANLIVQLGVVTEDLNRCWYEANTGQVITDIQRHVHHPAVRWLGATLDGRVEATGAVFESKFMLPWQFSEEHALEKYSPQRSTICG
jgi:hypothetical protein